MYPPIRNTFVDLGPAPTPPANLLMRIIQGAARSRTGNKGEKEKKRIRNRARNQMSKLSRRRNR